MKGHRPHIIYPLFIAREVSGVGCAPPSRRATRVQAKMLQGVTQMRFEALNGGTSGN